MNKKISYGFSMIEILISLLLLSFILLGFEGMEIFALHKNRNAWYLSVAINQLENMTERLQGLNKTISMLDIVNEWNLQNALLLPQGVGTVTDSFSSYFVSVYWGDVDHNQLCQSNHIGEKGCLGIELYDRP